jgi:23S rRNA pseudouridine2605 synthase
MRKLQRNARQSGESFLRAYWVAVPQALRARRVNRHPLRRRPPRPSRLRARPLRLRGRPAHLLPANDRLPAAPDAASSPAVSRASPSWNRSFLTEIYLCPPVPCQETLRTETAGQDAEWLRAAASGGAASADTLRARRQRRAVPAADVHARRLLPQPQSSMRRRRPVGGSGARPGWRGAAREHRRDGEPPLVGARRGGAAGGRGGGRGPQLPRGDGAAQAAGAHAPRGVVGQRQMHCVDAARLD